MPEPRGAVAVEVAVGAVAGEGPRACQRPPVLFHPGDCFPAQSACVLVTPKGTRWCSPRVPSLWALVFLSGVGWLPLPCGPAVVPRASLCDAPGPLPSGGSHPTPPRPAVWERARALQPRAFVDGPAPLPRSCRSALVARSGPGQPGGPCPGPCSALFLPRMPDPA